MHQPRILFVDAYDSFSNNIIALLKEQLDAVVEVIHMDDKRFATENDTVFHDFLVRFDGIVAGPGPGDPRNPEDLGLISRLWNSPLDICVPVLGVCLGFQSLALAFGACVGNLREPRHGMITDVTHRDQSLFKDCGMVRATQYHSLHVLLDGSQAQASPEDLWLPSEGDAPLQPLAWDLSDGRNGPVLMAVKHRTKPFWGVQYHPESICTNAAGSNIIRNWWSEALTWSLDRAALRKVDPGPPISASYFSDMDSSDSSILGSEGSSARSSIDCYDSPLMDRTIPTAESTPAVTRASSRIRQQPALRNVSWRKLSMPQETITVTTLLENLQSFNSDAMMFESGTKSGQPVRSETGRYSIIGCLDAAPRSLRYFTSTHMIRSTLSSSPRHVPATMQDVWAHIEAFMTANRASEGPAEVPFWGGLTGFITYEAGLETIDVAPATVKESHPDVWFLFVERSCVVDHVEKQIYIQTIKDNDEDWMQQTEKVIKEAFWHDRVDMSKHGMSSEPVMPAAESGEKGVSSKDRAAPLETTEQKPPSGKQPTRTTTAPSQSEYADKVRLCQSHIRAGDSYELCLTDQSTVSFSRDTCPSAWELYARLGATNPAPFGAYLRFGGDKGNDGLDEERGCASVTMLSSSPERFLSWSRAGKCQFRPIKGTVLKSSSMTRQKAEEILKSQKEQAENLMIVDLIRHDLHGVVGSGNVVVEKLMQVEEYETVYQLVSVIEGQLPLSGEKRGVDVLAASLPPGSMTGAPKKRSCELLREMEGSPRGLYSGVLGYLDVGGGGDFSVIIRTGFQWSDEDEWRIGAGGAVTALSTAEGEFEEMMVKRASTLRAFC